MADDLDARMIAFVTDVTKAMGLTAQVAVESLDDGTRIVVDGAGCEVLARRRGTGLDALQHVVNAAFRRAHPRGRIVVDACDYRRGRDAELRQAAVLLAEQARETGEPQEIGPLNPYQRRIVHLAVAADPAVSSESIGDAFMKTVLISAD